MAVRIVRPAEDRAGRAACPRACPGVAVADPVAAPDRATDSVERPAVAIAVERRTVAAAAGDRHATAPGTAADRTSRDTDHDTRAVARPLKIKSAGSAAPAGAIDANIATNDRTDDSTDDRSVDTGIDACRGK